MALNKAQLMASPDGPGSVPGAVGAVKAGQGISISSEGVISSTVDVGVTKLTAGNNIVISPSTGVGDLTISADVGVTRLLAGTGITLSPTTGVGQVTVTASNSGGGVTSVTSQSEVLVASPTTGAVQLRFVDSSANFFDPVQAVVGGSYNGRVGSGPLGVFDWIAPSGSNYAVVWSRARLLVYSTVTGDAPNQVAWAQNLNYSIQGTNCTFLQSGVGEMPAVAVSSRAGRGDGTCFTRFDLVSLPGTGDRNIRFSFFGACGAGPSNDTWNVSVDAPQVIILPFNL